MTSLKLVILVIILSRPDGSFDTRSLQFKGHNAMEQCLETEEDVHFASRWASDVVDSGTICTEFKIGQYDKGYRR